MKCVGAENGPPCKRCLAGGHEVRRHTKRWIPANTPPSAYSKNPTGASGLPSKLSHPIAPSPSNESSQEIRGSPAIPKPNGTETRSRPPILEQPRSSVPLRRPTASRFRLFSFFIPTRPPYPL